MRISKYVLVSFLSICLLLNFLSIGSNANEFTKFESSEKNLSSKMLKSEDINLLAIYEPRNLKNQYNNILEVREFEGNSQCERLSKSIQIFSDTDEELEYIAKLTEITFIENNIQKKYSILSATTTSDGTKDQNGVHLSGTIGWIDNFGVNNEFVYCSGGRSGYYHSDPGHYQVNHLHGGTLTADYFDTSFYGTPSAGNNMGYGFRLTVQSKSTQASGLVTLTVSTSIFD